MEFSTIESWKTNTVYETKVSLALFESSHACNPLCELFNLTPFVNSPKEYVEEIEEEVGREEVEEEVEEEALV